MAKQGQRRFFGRNQGEEEVYDDLQPYRRKRTAETLDGAAESPEGVEDVPTTGLESMDAPRQDEAPPRSSVYEVGGLESMMDNRGGEEDDISEEDLRLDDSFLPDDGEDNVLRRRPKKARVRPARPKRRREAPSWLRRAMIVLVTVVILFTLGFMVLSRVLSGQMAGDGGGSQRLQSMAAAPEGLIARIVTPIQSAFSNLTEGIAGYFRTMKLRANIETEYNKLRAENEQLVYQAMLAEELQQKLSSYENMFDEVSANESMNPLTATVIGRTDGNYFSTFTINRGTRDGVEDYMAVTISGALEIGRAHV